MNQDSESALPILSEPDRQTQLERAPRAARWKVWLVHTLRISMFVTILILIRLEHQQWTAGIKALAVAPDVDVEDIRPFLPGIESVTQWRENGTIDFLGEEKKEVGFAVHTVIESESIIGYVGSTELLLIFDDEKKIAGVQILNSQDTPEHVDAVISHPSFLKSWNGKSWNQAANEAGVDGVSGATLTSFAVSQSLRRRLGSDEPSLKFPKPVTLGELLPYFPDAAEIRKREGFQNLFDLVGAKSNDPELNDKESSKRLGAFVRTSPVADTIHGYQGPSDVLVLFDSNDQFQRIVIRSSFDNEVPEPFVEYVADDEYFMVDLFSEVDRAGLATFDDDEVEGVSGATMTSSGIYSAVKLAAQVSLEKQEIRAESDQLVLQPRDWGTLAILLAATLFTFSRLSRYKILRLLFQLVLVGYLGFVNGDILSQTLLVGWVQNGVPWKNAVGLLVLTLAAFLVPVFTKQNIYCHQICPFGAAQQLIRRTIKKPKAVPRRLHKILVWIPGGLLVGVVVSVMLHWGWNLAAIEPFDAFAFRIAGWSTLVIAVVGLIASFFQPMAYCRYGCPTGRALEFVRRHGRSSQICAADFVCLVLLVMGIWNIAG